MSAEAPAALATYPDLDLTECEREPIRTPGSIQPHGFLIVIDEVDFRVRAVSENIDALLQMPASAVLGRSIFEAFGPHHRDALEERFLDTRPEAGNPLPLACVGPGDLACELIAHRIAGSIVLEIERVSPDAAGVVSRVFHAVRGAIARLQSRGELQTLCDAACEETALLTGFDRVMVYRFGEDWHGAVVAERHAAGMDPYLGLHYPASDIPSQARELYRTNWLRYIRNVGYEPVRIVSLEDTPIDLSASVLRSVSPVHIRYLENMGVGATLTVSLLQNGRLWGLIACHHRTAKAVPYEVRTACELIGRTLSLQVAALDENATLAYRISLRRIQAGFIERSMRARTLREALVSEPQTLLRLVACGGAAICVEGKTTLVGRTPGEAAVAKIVAWLQAERGDEICALPSLATIAPQFAEIAEHASGLLALPISRRLGTYLLWFRPEHRRTIAWGGDPQKPVVRTNGRLQPRASFERWNELVRYRGMPWLAWEIEAVDDLRSAILGIVMKRTEELEEANAALAVSNAELDSFAHIASHDLKEPLRGIHNYATYLIEDYGSVLDDHGRERLETLVRLTLRMDGLIESLLHLSHIARIDFDGLHTEMDDVVAGVIDLYGPSIEQRGAEVHVHGPLPVVACDHRRIAEVVNNLVSNALKYSDRAQPKIEIGSVRSKLPPPNRELGAASVIVNRPLVTMYVRDDGIGIREKHLETIFRMFKRLHAQTKYGGGTGAGLAFARKIVERHGGSIWAESALGSGTTFYFTLPEAEE